MGFSNADNGCAVAEVRGAFVGSGDVHDTADGQCCWVPSVDVHEQGDGFTICADLPGVDPSGIDITVDHGVLVLKGQREFDRSVQEGCRRAERWSGSFCRRFVLPDTADPECIEARSEQGVLWITVAKQDKALPRRIEVQC
jgi:HSP20 family protein